MNPALALELFGYLGSVIILVSMLMTSVVKLRVINTVGSVVFATYAVLIHSYPTALLNICLAAVNIYHLVKLSRKGSDNYDIRRVNAGDGIEEWFTEKYESDIKRFFPSFDHKDASKLSGFAVFCDDRAAGITLGDIDEDHFDVVIDYTTPAFRDCSVGTHLYKSLPSYGIRSLSCAADTPEHLQYIEKMGFMPDGSGKYLKKLKA